MNFFLGVDGGGTRTRVALADESGVELARAEGSATLVDPANPKATLGVIAELCREAVEKADVDLPVAGLWAGIAGAGIEPTRSAVETALREAGLSSRTVVGADAEATFHDAFPSGPGILLIAGTGSIGLGRGAGDARIRVGGWGSLLGDEGSGYGIGMSTLRALVRGEDGRGDATDLRSPVLQALGVSDSLDLIKWVAAAKKADVASLVPLVRERADAGDEVAQRVIDNAVRELVGHVRTLIRRLDPWIGVPEVALAGGLIDKNGPLRSRLIKALERLPCRLQERALDGARGAYSLAIDLAGPADGSPPAV